MDCHVQIFLDGRWKTAAVFEPDAQKLDKGIAAGGRLQYDTDKRNQQVLSNEASYLEVARKFGIRTGEPLVYEDDVLFVPRFDRKVTDGLVE